MRTRKIFMHEDGIYEGVSRLPDPHENQPKEVVSLYDSFDRYPEKQHVINEKTEKFEGAIDLPLGEDYKLQSQIYIYSHIQNLDTRALDVLNE